MCLAHHPKMAQLFRPNLDFAPVWTEIFEEPKSNTTRSNKRRWNDAQCWAACIAFKSVSSILIRSRQVSLEVWWQHCMGKTAGLWDGFLLGLWLCVCEMDWSKYGGTFIACPWNCWAWRSDNFWLTTSTGSSRGCLKSNDHQCEPVQSEIGIFVCYGILIPHVRSLFQLILSCIQQISITQLESRCIWQCNTSPLRQVHD